MEVLLFYFIAAVMVIAGFMVVRARNPINSALSLVTTFIGLAVLYVMLEAPFVAAIQILVYAGAIMILIIFTIMLLNLGSELKKRYTHGLAWGGLGALLVLLVTTYFVDHGVVEGAKGDMTLATIQEIGHTELIGTAIFTKFLLPFEITSILLLVAIIGAVVIAKREV